jgi:uncharacterized protein YodC (DUF2158 family)
MSENEQIQVGDIVTLKSGGPAMTVEDVNPFASMNAKTIEVGVVWFNNCYEKLSARFLLSSVKKKT